MPPRPYRSALSPSPLFPQKAAHQLPANLLENDFPPSYLFCQPFISQNLRIILAHNRRRCGNDFIADARSARFPQIFAKSSTVDVSVSRISNSASARPEMMLETSSAADARRMHGINPGICRLAAVNVKVRIKPPEPGNRPHQHLVGVKAVPRRRPVRRNAFRRQRTNTRFLHLLIITPISPPTSLSSTTPAFSSG